MHNNLKATREGLIRYSEELIYGAQHKLSPQDKKSSMQFSVY